eukprot:3445865-Amphidinium_carterae.1
MTSWVGQQHFAPPEVLMEIAHSLEEDLISAPCLTMSSRCSLRSSDKLSKTHQCSAVAVLEVAPFPSSPCT